MSWVPGSAFRGLGSKAQMSIGRGQGGRIFRSVRGWRVGLGVRCLSGYGSSINIGGWFTAPDVGRNGPKP